MDFSVIICTYNRSQNLPRCLGALAEQQGVGDLKWEVVVVDNNSTDDTRRVIEELSQSLPVSIRYAFEEQQGLNYARNMGIKASRGNYFAYIDDDIIVTPQWLKSIYSTFLENDADSVGGRIHLDPSIELPRWIHTHPELQGFLGYQDQGENPQRLDGKTQYPYGGNMAFNRRVVDKIGYFDPRLGRKGEGRKRSELFKGAETDYMHRLSETGEARIYYHPDAIVFHRVEPFQLKKRYFFTIHYNAGYQRALHDSKQFPKAFKGAPLYMYRQLLSSSGKYLWQLITKGPDWAFRQKMNVGHLLGTINGYIDRDKTC